MKPPLVNFLHFFGVMATRSVLDAFTPLRTVSVEPPLIRPDEFRVWMVGHATVLINLFGTVILTDPVLMNWLPYPRRIIAPAFTAHELPRLDIVLISHAHMDHLNRATLARIAHKTITLVIPKGCEDLVRDLGFAKMISLDWDESCSVDSVEVRAVRPEHWGERYPWQTRDRRYHAYVIRRQSTALFFVGDSAYGNYFKEVGAAHSPALAIMPIGSYHPERYYHVEHMSPEESVQALIDLNAQWLIPTHWGVFRFTREPLDEPPQRLMARATSRGVAERLRILSVGESTTISA